LGRVSQGHPSLSGPLAGVLRSGQHPNSLLTHSAGASVVAGSVAMTTVASGVDVVTVSLPGSLEVWAGDSEVTG